MKSVSIILVMLFISICVNSQQKTHQSTEIYSPIPPIGKVGTNKKPPFDIIILFALYNFDQCESVSSETVQWNLKDSVKEVIINDHEDNCMRSREEHNSWNLENMLL